jgi:hypothetical protein
VLSNLCSRHWAVLLGSLAAVLSSWGLTPVQAGIFATSQVNLIQEMPLFQSISFMPTSNQTSSMSAQMAQSVANILWLNETIPPFMTRDYAVAPFGPMNSNSPLFGQQPQSIMGQTTRFGVNITCETPILWEGTQLNSSWGCSMPLVSPMATNESVTTTPYSSAYIGWASPDGSAEFYLNSTSICPSSEPRTFYIQWAKILIPGSQYMAMTPQDKFNATRTTRQWCRSSYFAQNVWVNATLPGYKVIDMVALEEPQPLPTDLINISEFEAQMNMGHPSLVARSQFPTSNWPNQTSFLSNMNLSMIEFPVMSAFAIAASQKLSEDYFDSSVLVAAYESAYRILFARRMTEILQDQKSGGIQSSGSLQASTQAIVIVHVFARIAQAFLAGCAAIAIIIFLVCRTRPLHLQKDPSTIGALMSLTAGNDGVLNRFKAFDDATEKTLEQTFNQHDFRLASSPERLKSQISSCDRLNLDTSLESVTWFDMVKGIQPFEFKIWTGAMVFAVLSGLFISLPILFSKANSQNGK